MRQFYALGFALAVAAAPAFGQEQAYSGGPRSEVKECSLPATPDRLHGVTPEGDLILSGGRLAKLAGLRLPDDPSRREEAIAWLQARAEHHVLIQGGPALDRWNRLSVRVRLTEGPAPLDLARGLIEAGLGLVDAQAGEAFCQPELLIFEAAARAQSLGLWKDGRYNPLETGQADRLRDRIGTFTLVEGRIRTVGERKQRTYLNFGGHWAEDFTIIIPAKTWKLMAERGLASTTLKGQRIRARGILESWQGTALTIQVPEMIERLAGEGLPR